MIAVSPRNHSLDSRESVTGKDIQSVAGNSK